jgi:hypothetical protein
MAVQVTMYAQPHKSDTCGQRVRTRISKDRWTPRRIATAACRGWNSGRDS